MMKNFIIIIIIHMFSIMSVSSQYNEYPRIVISDSGDTIVEMTLRQAQVLDSKADLVDLLTSMNRDLMDMDSLFIKVINDKDNVITSLKSEVKALKDVNANKSDIIDELKSSIKAYHDKTILMGEELKLKDDIIMNMNRKISKQRVKNIAFGVTGGAIIAALIGTVVYISTK